jgi:hypothetical protein
LSNDEADDRPTHSGQTASKSVADAPAMRPPRLRRKAIETDIDERRSQEAAAEVLREIGEKDVERMLAGLASHMEQTDKAALKHLLADVAERIEFDPARLTCRIHYRINSGEFLACRKRRR